MKYIFFWVAFLVLFIIVFPIIINIVFFYDNKELNYIDNDFKVNVYFHETKEIKTMLLEEYILGVVIAEMPATFELEALKAQAVAARTYTMNKIKNYTNNGVHDAADICTDFSHCQAYISKEKAMKNWGKNASVNFKKCKKAVYETSGEIMIYDNELVKAVFHSTSSGRTENAKDVWGTNVDYLVSVESNGETLSPSYKSELVIENKKFKEKFKEYDVNFENQLIGKMTYTQGGAVKSIEIGNKIFEGKQIRSFFNLRSACFEIAANNENVIFKVTGNGHGVGMSQYGANYMASQGNGYKEILKKYYTGVNITKIYE